MLANNLPDRVLKLIDLSTLEICKDSFIDKKLADYYSDILYRVMLIDGSAGYIHVLFEHKSYYDKYLHLQLLEYMINIWRLHIKQHERKTVELPIVIPFLICHAKRPWPEEALRLTSMLSGPVDELAEYIPDFGFVRYDLHDYSDEEIKGTIIIRVVLLLFKYIYHPDFLHKLPKIFSLFKTLIQKETGLEYLETVLRYLVSVLDENEMSLSQIMETAEKSISKNAGGYVMTLAEKFRNEGWLEGMLEGKLEGMLEGLREAIELGITLKFPGNIDTVMAKVNQIDDLETLKKMTEAIKTAKDSSEILSLH